MLPSLPSLFQQTHGAVSNIAKPNVYFQERAGLRAQLAAAVEGSATATVLVHGPGGFGKSQLVRHYVRGLLLDKTVQVAWVVEARSRVQIATGFRALAVALGVVESELNDKSGAEVVACVQQTLVANPLLTSWVFMLDDLKRESDLADVHAGLGGVLPPGKAGCTIITSRSPSLAQVLPSFLRQ